MKEIFKKEELFSLPNQLSFLRLLLIPVFAYLYCGLENYVAAILVLIFSALTDILDGIIARRYHLVTDLGKILDPAADKLTQAAVLVCLSLRYPLLWILTGLLVVKELCMLGFGYAAVRRTGRVHSARWYGKLCTTVLYGSMGLLVLWPVPPAAVVQGVFGLCAAALLMALVLYIRYDLQLIKEASRRAN